MKINEFIEKSREHLLKENLLNKSGSVLYSSYKTLKDGDFYLIGLNPGGKETISDTIKDSLNDLEESWKKKIEKNAYIDENWYPYPGQEGKAPLQKRIIYMMRELGRDIHKVCAGNLIFTRSQDQDGSHYPINADKCWPVHEMILKIVQPKIIIAFGNGNISPYNYLQKKHFEIHKKWPENLDEKNSGHGNWKCRRFNFDIGYLKFLVIGLPHLSRYDITSHKEVTKWIHDLMRKAGLNETNK
jgi:hypothetical protein